MQVDVFAYDWSDDVSVAEVEGKWVEVQDCLGVGCVPSNLGCWLAM